MSSKSQKGPRHGSYSFNLFKDVLNMGWRTCQKLGVFTIRSFFSGKSRLHDFGGVLLICHLRKHLRSLSPRLPAPTAAVHSLKLQRWTAKGRTVHPRNG